MCPEQASDYLKLFLHLVLPVQSVQTQGCHSSHFVLVKVLETVESDSSIFKCFNIH